MKKSLVTLIFLMMFFSSSAMAYVCNARSGGDGGGAFNNLVANMTGTPIDAETNALPANVASTDLTDVVPAIGCALIQNGARASKKLYKLFFLVSISVLIYFSIVLFQLVMAQDYKAGAMLALRMFGVLIFTIFDYTSVVVQPVTNIVFWGLGFNEFGLGDLIGNLLGYLAGFFIAIGVVVKPYPQTWFLGLILLGIAGILLFLLLKFVYDVLKTVAASFLSLGLVFFFGHFLITLAFFPFIRHLYAGWFRLIVYQIVEIICIFVSISFVTAIAIQFLGAIPGGSGGFGGFLGTILNGVAFTGSVMVFLLNYVLIFTIIFALLDSALNVAKQVATGITGGQGSRDGAGGGGAIGRLAGNAGAGAAAKLAGVATGGVSAVASSVFSAFRK